MNAFSALRLVRLQQWLSSCLPSAPGQCSVLLMRAVGAAEQQLLGCAAWS